MNANENLKKGPSPFLDESAAHFASLYPRRTGMLTHQLSHHPLLRLDALADAALRMNPAHVECRGHATKNGEDFSALDRKDKNVGQIIRSIESSNCWTMLRFVEQLPEYRELLRETLANLETKIMPQTGILKDLRAYIFISSPGTLTPFHFDPEYNILFQIKGRKQFSVFPPTAPYLSDPLHEHFHISGENLLPWKSDFALRGTCHDIGPGDAVYVPYKSPHWVKVGTEPSISLSMTWRSRWSILQDDAYRMNAMLRKWGYAPQSPAPWPQRSIAKSYGWKIFNKTGLGGLLR